MVVKKIAVLFSGTGSNLVAILEKLHGKTFGDTKIEVALTLTNKSDAPGIQKARNFGLESVILELFKGARAIDESFQSDMQVGGVSVHFVSAELDGGKIIAQKAFARKDKTREEWEAKIHEIEHEILPKTIKKLLVKNQIFCKNSDD